MQQPLLPLSLDSQYEITSIQSPSPRLCLYGASLTPTLSMNIICIQSSSPPCRCLRRARYGGVVVVSPRYEAYDDVHDTGHSSTAGAYHLLTIVHAFKPHLSCFSQLLYTTEATT